MTEYTSKICNTCNVEYPNTTKYYRLDTRNGLMSPRCRRCQFERMNLVRQRQQGPIVITPAIVRRFWLRVLLPNMIGVDECWEWDTKTARRYGVFYIGQKGLWAHRLSYEFAYGPIPDGMEICHSCDNTFCVNPAHLWVGTHKQNMEDMAAKGRSTKGLKKGQMINDRNM